MGLYVFRGEAGDEERHETTEATAVATVARYAYIGFQIRAFRVEEDGGETEVFPTPTRIRDPWANLKTNRRA